MAEHKHHEACGDECQDDHLKEELSNLDLKSKTKKNEKMFVKFMKRFHLSQYKKITRIVIKTNKGFIMYINDPTVMISDKNDDSFVALGDIVYATG